MGNHALNAWSLLSVALLAACGGGGTGGVAALPPPPPAAVYQSFPLREAKQFKVEALSHRYDQLTKTRPESPSLEGVSNISVTRRQGDGAISIAFDPTEKSYTVDFGDRTTKFLYSNNNSHAEYYHYFDQNGYLTEALGVSEAQSTLPVDQRFLTYVKFASFWRYTEGERSDDQYSTQYELTSALIGFPTEASDMPKPVKPQAMVIFREV